MSSPHGPLTDVASVLERLKRPKRAVVTAGMPYVNGPLHLGHLAGAQLPADIMSRFLGMMIGRDNVLFVCGSDEHGSTSEVSALQAGVPIRDYVNAGHARHQRSLESYTIGRARFYPVDALREFVDGRRMRAPARPPLVSEAGS